MSTPISFAAAPPVHRRVVRVGHIVVSVAVVIAVFAFAVPRFADYGSVWAVLRALSWVQVTLLVTVTAFSVVTPWLQLIASLPGLTFGQAAVNCQTASSMANTVPGGGVLAVGLAYVMFRSWGFSSAGIALSVLLTGLWNSLLKLALPILAVAVLALTGAGRGPLLVPALVGMVALAAAVALLVLLLRRTDVARWIGGTLGALVSRLRRLVRKPAVSGWGQNAVLFRGQCTELLARRWPTLTLTTAASHFSQYLVFLLAVRAVGIPGGAVSWAEVLGIFALARLLTAAPITPGGVGLVELTYIAGLVLSGGDDFRPRAVAATLLFRLLTYGLQIPSGGVTYLLWRRRTGWRELPATAAEPQPAT
jgi:putative heme transporter